MNANTHSVNFLLIQNYCKHHRCKYSAFGELNVNQYTCVLQRVLLEFHKLKIFTSGTMIMLRNFAPYPFELIQKNVSNMICISMTRFQSKNTKMLKKNWFKSCTFLVLVLIDSTVISIYIHIYNWNKLCFVSFHWSRFPC